MEFEVFLSFRGLDTRRDFASCLYYDMVEKGIRVFKDDKELKAGEKIEELFKALKDSQIYIPIFSRDFASSVWCLREVVHMVNCTKNSDRKKEILPIFLDVKPEDVKSSTGLYSNALSKLEKEKVKYGHGTGKLKYDPSEVKSWRDALREVASRVGWKLEGLEYGELIKLIVREVLLKLKGKSRCLPNHLVETDDLGCIEELLDVHSDNNVRFVIIHGTGGIGKSTLASVIFNRFQSKFNCSSFLEDVKSHNLLDMQKKLLSETLGSNSAQELYDTNDGIDRIIRGLGRKKALVVVDNVDEKKQLENLVGSCNWFGCGSRIIVTLRDIRIIRYKDNQRQPSNYMDYSVQEMPFDLALQLFSKHAFRSDTPPKDYYKFSKEVVSSIGRLPLTLEVVGSLFASTAKSEWDETLEDLKHAPYTDVRQTLMISINKLDDIEKVIFLDIACFCIGEDKTYACYMWRNRGYSPHGAINVLLLTSLIKINEYNRFWMHDEVRDIGRYIVKKDNVEDAGKRSWVWIDENTLEILKRNEEKPDVRALSMGISHDLTPEELARLPKLRFLGGERMNFKGDFKNLLHNLMWLSWRHCPLDLSATNFDLVNLVVLDLSQSDITDNWVGWLQIKMAKKLKVLDLTGCKKLTKTPDFSELGKLEMLILAWCVNLSTFDSSIGKLKLLSTLNIQGCNSLQGLPDEISSLECLSEIIIPSGVKPFKLSETLGNLKSLMHFAIHFHYGISLLPHSIGRLTNLTKLSLRACKNLHKLPDSIGKLEFLVELDLQLSGIFILPDSIGNLKRLKVIRLRHSKIHEIPSALGGVKSLEVLDASFCSYLRGRIPWELWSLTCLRILDFHGTPISRLPTKINGFSNLQELKISCNLRHPSLELPLSLKCLVVEAAEFPILPNLPNLVDLHHLEVSGNQEFPDMTESSESSESEDISEPWEQRGEDFLGKDEEIPRLHSLANLHGLYLERLVKKSLSALEYLERLRELKISSWGFMESTPNLSGLKGLQDLHLSDLPTLKEIPGLRELESLKFLRIIKCDMIEQFPNLSKLKNLQHLKLYDCSEMRAVEGLKELSSLKSVEIQKCKSLRRLPDLPAFTKLCTNWIPLEATKCTIQTIVPWKPTRLP